MLLLKKYKFTVAVCIAVLILSVTSGGSLPNTAVPNIDKIAHTAFYFCIGLAMFADYFFENRTLSFTKKDLPKFLFFPFIYGAIIEIIQSFLPYRTAEWLDLLSNLLGELLAILFILILKKRLWKKNTIEYRKYRKCWAKHNRL
jgi:VanZ family protein